MSLSNALFKLYLIRFFIASLFRKIQTNYRCEDMFYFEENPAVAKAIYEKAMQAQRAREAAKKARELVRRKSCLLYTSP